MAVNRVYVEGDYINFRDSAGVFVQAIHYSEFSYFNDNATIQFIHRRDTAQLYPITSVEYTEVCDEAGTPYVAPSDTLDDFLTIFAALLPTATGGGGGGSAPDIATYEVQIDLTNSQAVRVLTVFDPVTNAPTRTFKTLSGAAYVPSDASQVVPFVASSVFAATIENIDNNVGDTKALFENLLIQLGIDLTIGDTVAQQVFLNVRSAGSQTITTPKVREIQLIAIQGTYTVGSVSFPLGTASGGVTDFSVKASVGRAITLGYEVDVDSLVLEITLIG